MFDTLIRRLDELSYQIPNKTAVAFKKESLTYEELYTRVKQVGTRLVKLGIQKGDRVPFSAVSKPEMLAIYLGIQYIGAVAVFVDKNATADSMAFIYKDVQAALFITDKKLQEYENECRCYSLRGLFREAEEEDVFETVYVCPGQDELAEMIYTTGTTGRPKGVMLSYLAVYQIWTNTVDGIGMQSNDKILLPLPLNHSFALRVMRAALYIGETVVLQNGFTFAKEIENNMEAFGCNAIAIVPASVETISKQMQDRFADIMGNFRYIEVSAGSLSVEQRKRLTSLLPHTVIYNTWGSSESGGALFLNVTDVVNDETRCKALGIPIQGVEVKTLDAEGREFVSDREHPGRMALRGNMQMMGYWNRPQETEHTLRDGWLLTGDMIYIENGYVYMLGRADNIINVGGEKVSPLEVENIASEYANILECAVIGVEDPEGILGQIPVMYLVPRNNFYAEEELRVLLSDKLEKYKIPVYFIKLLELPRNQMEKVDRKALKVLWDNQGSSSLINACMQVLMTRRSIRRFTEQEIPKEILEVIVKAGYYAPTGHNMQTWQFTIIQNKNEIAKVKKAVETTAAANQVYCYGFDNPTALILVSNDERDPNSCQNASCASENIMLAAWSYGIGSVWLNPLKTLRKKEPAKTLLDEYGIPENHIIWSMIALGYPVADGTLLKKNTDVVKWIY